MKKYITFQVSNHLQGEVCERCKLKQNRRKRGPRRLKREAGWEQWEALFETLKLCLPHFPLQGLLNMRPSTQPQSPVQDKATIFLMSYLNEQTQMKYLAILRDLYLLLFFFYLLVRAESMDMSLHMCPAEDNFQESVLSFLHTGHRAQAQVIKHSSSFYLLTSYQRWAYINVQFQ